MSTKQDLFGDEDAADHGFKVNEEFAKRFDHNKRREMLDRAKDKYGENLDLLDEASSSSSEDDSEAELINPRFEAKFFKLLTDIRKNNPQLKEEKEVFSDNDFEVSGDEEGAGEKKEKFTLKDQIRERAVQKIKKGDISASDSEDSDEHSGVFRKIGMP